MSLKALEIKIKSTRNLQKITASMKMVASAKMRPVEQRLMAGRPFFESVKSIFPQPEVDFDETNQVAKLHLDGANKHHVQTVTSDAGLCGAVNTLACKHTRLGVYQMQEAGTEDFSLSVVGDRGRSQLRRLFGDYMTNTYDECYKVPFNFGQASVIAGSILDVDADRTHVVYNKYESAVAYETSIFQMDSLTAIDTEGKEDAGDDLFKEYEFEPENKAEALENLKEFATGAAVFGCVIENQCSEMSSKVQAMDNASTNAGDMVDKLTLKYNRARQASITTELIEIISGAAALDD